MITKTFKLAVIADTEEQMQKEEERLSMIYGVEEIEGVKAEIACTLFSFTTDTFA